MRLPLYTLALTLFAAPVQAAFVGGVETFDGTTKDTVAWQEYTIDVGGSVTQNDAITLQSATYVTNAQTVAVGQGVRADVRILTPTQDTSTLDYFRIVLTNRSSGSAVPAFDSQQTALAYEVHPDTFAATINNNGDGFVSPTNLAFDTTYQFELFRVTASTVVARVYDTSGNLLLQDTTSGATLTDPLYIALTARYDTVAVVDNVTIVPEPGALALAALGLLGAAGRRRPRAY